MKQFPVSQIYCGYNSTNIVFGQTNEPINIKAFKNANFIASKKTIIMTVPSRIRLSNTSSKDIKKALDKLKSDPILKEKKRIEFLEYTSRFEPRMRFFKCNNIKPINVDDNNGNLVTSLKDYERGSIQFTQDALVPQNKLDIVRYKKEYKTNTDNDNENEAENNNKQFRALIFSLYFAINLT